MPTSQARLEKRREYQHAYYRRNKKACLARQLQWAKNNPDKYKTSQEKYRKGQSRHKYLYSLARRRSLKKELEFNLELTDIIIPDVCPLLGIKLDQGDQYSRSTIDRIDSSKGYIKNNIQIISFRANMLKNNATLEELKLLVQNMEKLR